MDAQELRNLQEAYMEVVENQQLDEVTNRRSLKFQHRADELDNLRTSVNTASKAGRTVEADL